ncbi:MAG: DNRLRE domain-containing protein, partial [Mycobacteriales bacterium]
TTLVRQGTRIKPVATAGDITFSAGGDVDPVASLATAGKSLSLRWPGHLPAPTVSGDIATYAGVRPGIDLVLQARRQGFEQSLILRERPTAAPVFRLPLKLSGLSVAKADNGSLRFTDASGRLVAESPQPRMWGAVKDSAGDPKREAPVTTQVNDTPSGRELEMRPDLSFLRDPSVTYPVTIDPSIQMTILADTWVSSAPSSATTTSQGTSTDLRSGKYSGTAAIQRSLMKFDSSTYSNRHVLSATLALYNYYSPACTAKETRIFELSGDFSNSTTWSNQPGIVSTVYGSSTGTYGATGCAGNWVRFDLTALIEHWARVPTSNHGLEVRAADEADTGAWKKYYSSDYSNTSYIPTLAVTYNTFPVIDRIESPAHESYVPTRTPQFRPVYRDPDGSSGYADVEVWNSSLTTLVASGRSLLTMSGATAAWTIPTTSPLTDGAVYAWRARAYDGTDVGQSWTTFSYFTVDATTPPAPGVTSAQYPSNVWSPRTADGSATFSFSSTASDINHYLYGLDISGNAAYGAATSLSSIVLSPPDGWHHLSVWAVNHGGLISPPTDYQFGVGFAAVTSPTEGRRTQRRVTLRALANPDKTSVDFRYRRGEFDNWTVISAANVTNGGTQIAGWPVATQPTSTGVTSPDLVWDVAAEVGSDGPVSLIACFHDASGAESCTEPVNITLDQNAFGDSYATAPVGPGTVSLLTGNYSVTDTDVSVDAFVSDLTVTRTFNSRQPADPPSDGSLFGPGWATTLPVESAGSDYRSLRDAGAFVVVTDEEGGLIGFRLSPDNTYVPQEDETGLALAKVGSDFVLTDLDGNKTTFEPAGTGGYRPKSVSQPGSNQTTTYAYDASGRIIRVVAPNASGTTCTDTSWPAGCRGLLFTYDTGTPSRLTSITLKTGATATQVVVQYSYDADRRLVSAWDPRISPNLVTRYTYDSAGRLATITAPGRAAWTMAYGSGGELTSVSRPHPNSTDQEKTSLVYGVPLTAGDGRPAMTSGDVAQWGQTDVPTDATAIFPARAATDASASPVNYAQATITYIDVDGRPVNVASPGGYVMTSEYDQFGNVVRELSAANRASALAAADPAARAARLSTRRLYSPDGIELSDVYGPVHLVTLADGTSADARTHTHTDYDQGAELGHPQGDKMHLPVKVTTEASVGPDVGSGTSNDARVTTYDYAITRGDGSVDDTGWTLHTPLRTTVDPGGLNLATTTLYDASSGLLTERRLPKAPNGGSAATTLYRYYTADASSADPDCVNKPDWARLPCKTLPAAQPGGSLPDIPVSRTSNYNSLLQPTTVVDTSSEVVNGTRATRTRTTTTTYDAAGRVTDAS